MALSGSLHDFPLDQVLHLLESSTKTGKLEVRAGSESGVLEVTDGALTGAHFGDDVSEAALGAIFAMASSGEFRFSPGDTGAPNLGGSLDEILQRGGEERERLAAIRADIPDDRMRFTLSERAASGGPITVTPDQWRVLLAVDGHRDVRAIAQRNHAGRLATLRHLHELLGEGLIDAREAAPEPEPAPAPRVAKAAPPEPPALREEPRARVPEPPALRDEPRPRTPEPPVLKEEPPQRPEPPAWTPAAPAPSFETRPFAPPSEATAPTDDLSAALAERLAALTPPPSTSPQDFWQSRVQQQQPPEPAPPAFHPPAPAAPAAPDVDDRLAALRGLAAEAPEAPPAPYRAEPGDIPVSHYLPADATAPVLEAPTSAPREEKKKGGLFGLFGGGKAAAEPRGAARMDTGATASARLAALANALVAEFNSGQYGKSRVDERMNVRLRLVDEQADPIDRPLPLADDRLDVAAIDRGDYPPDQVLPYLATLVRQIYDDAERVFGKDKARKAYRSTVQRALEGDDAFLRDPSLALILPKA